MCPSLGSGAVEPIARSSPHIASYPSSLPLRPFSSFTPHTPPPSLPAPLTPGNSNYMQLQKTGNMKITFLEEGKCI